MGFSLFHAESWSKDRILATFPDVADVNRGMSQDKFEHLQLLIARFGLVLPLVVNTRFERLVDGRQRARAAFALGYAQLSVCPVDLDDRDEITLQIALNTEYGEWVDDTLAVKVASLAANNMTELTGLPDAEVMRLISKANHLASSPSRTSAKAGAAASVMDDLEPDSSPDVLVTEQRTQGVKGGHPTPRYAKFICDDAVFTCPIEEYDALLARLDGHSVKGKTESFAQLLGVPR